MLTTAGLDRAAARPTSAKHRSSIRREHGPDQVDLQTSMLELQSGGFIPSEEGVFCPVRPYVPPGGSFVCLFVWKDSCAGSESGLVTVSPVDLGRREHSFGLSGPRRGGDEDSVLSILDGRKVFGLRTSHGAPVAEEVPRMRLWTHPSSSSVAGARAGAPSG